MMETRIGATQDPALGLSAPGVMDPVLFMSSDVCAVIQCLHTRDCAVERCRGTPAARKGVCGCARVSSRVTVCSRSAVTCCPQPACASGGRGLYYDGYITYSFFSTSCSQFTIRGAL